MFSISDDIQVKDIARFFGPAEVLNPGKDGAQVLLALEKGEEKFEAWGRVMMSAFPLSSGDVVLAAGENIDEIYILGVLSSSKPVQNNKLITADGTYAVIENKDSVEKLQINSKEGKVIFEYRPDTGKSYVNPDSGEIEFSAKGDINFISGGNINFKSRQFIELESRQGIRFLLKNFFGQLLSSLALNQKKINMSSPALSIESGKADFRISSATFTGSSFSAVVKRAKLITGRIEHMAEDIITRAKNIFKTVEELSELKTGRVRMLVKSTLHFKSKNSYQVSEEDFKVNAEKIHLG